jgi:Icc protein
MKIALIADIHHGPQSHNKVPGWDALEVVRAFAGFANEVGADLLVDLGDRISDTTIEADRVAEREVVDALAAFRGPRVHLLGNHDVAKLTPDDNAMVLGQPMGNRVVDLGDARLIVFQPDAVMTKPVGFSPVAKKHIEWLVDALEADERPAVIASHLPFSGHSQAGNYYFENAQRFSTYPNSAEVRAAVERTGKAAVWLAGHVHWNTCTTVQGIHHFTLHSVSETFTTTPHPAAAYGLLDITGGELEFSVYGREPMVVRLPFRRSGDQRWIPPLAPWWVPNEPAQARKRASRAKMSRML